MAIPAHTDAADAGAVWPAATQAMEMGALVMTASPADMPMPLKPCPFCGGTDLYWPHGTDPAVIKCGGKNGCGAESGVQSGEYGEQTEAMAIAAMPSREDGWQDIAAWNRRPPVDEATVERAATALCSYMPTCDRCKFKARAALTAARGT